MKDNKLEFTTPDEAEVVFYEAFIHCDSQVMAALWGDGEVVCVHPGSAAILGHEAVQRSWRHILDQARHPELEFRVLRRSVSQDLAVHLVAEQLNQTLVLATNVYQRFHSGWLMVEHHASLVQPHRPSGETLQ